MAVEKVVFLIEICHDRLLQIVYCLVYLLLYLLCVILVIMIMLKDLTLVLLFLGTFPLIQNLLNLSDLVILSFAQVRISCKIEAIMVLELVSLVCRSVSHIVNEIIKAEFLILLL